MRSESLNSRLYASKPYVYATLRWLTYINTVLALVLLVYAHGIATNPVALRRSFQGIDAILATFVLFYLVRILYSFKRKDFLRRKRFEGILMLLVAINLISTYIFGSPFFYTFFQNIGIELSMEVYRVGITVYMLFLLIIEILETRLNFLNLDLKPATTFIGSFILLIGIGTGMFMLPKMTVTPGGLSFIDALFMSTSAACVTGLAVVDPGSYLTFSGQMVLLSLVQLGGLGIVSFATFFATFIRQGIGLKHHVVMQDMMDSESLYSAKRMFRKIIGITLGIELIGAVCIFATWHPEVPFLGLGSKIYFSIFHSITAFCNAGFSLFPAGLFTDPVRFSYITHLIIAGLIFFGGLGFPTILDVFSPEAMRERMRLPWKNWTLLSRISIYTSVALVLFGTVGFYLLEYWNTLADQNFVEGLITSFFQSVSTRTAGFNTVDVSQLTVPTLLLVIFLMFIGGSPGSTGGGIKTTTFFVIILSVITTIRGKQNIEVAHRTIPHSVAYKAFSIFAFAAIINLIGLFILTITDSQFSVVQLAFEQISSFATVGLSTGITAGLSTAGKVVLVVTMYIGRVGILTLALALSTPAQSSKYKYPKSHVVVG